jgi:hypothetical protein
MKKFQKTIVFVILLALYSPLFSQEKSFTHSFQIKPLVYVSSILNSVLDEDSETYSFIINLEYQYAINNHINLSLVPHFSMTRGKNWSIIRYGIIADINDMFTEYYYDLIAYGIDPGIIIRPAGNRLKGFYLKSYCNLAFGHINISDYDIKGTYFAFGIMGELGYQWILKNGFTIVVGFGGGKDWHIPITDNKLEYRDELFKLDVNLGFGYSF